MRYSGASRSRAGGRSWSSGRSRFATTLACPSSARASLFRSHAREGLEDEVDDSLGLDVERHVARAGDGDERDARAFLERAPLVARQPHLVVIAESDPRRDARLTQSTWEPLLPVEVLEVPLDLCAANAPVVLLHLRDERVKALRGDALLHRASQRLGKTEPRERPEPGHAVDAVDPAQLL